MRSFRLKLGLAAGLAGIAPTYAGAQTVPGNAPQMDGLQSYFDNWSSRVAEVRATQPSWSSPLVTTTALLEQRVRFDFAEQYAGNNIHTANLDGGRGLDLIISNTEEIQIAAAPYIIRNSNVSSKQNLTAWGDWPVFRFKQRLASGAAGDGDYVVSAWLQIQLPTGSGKVTSHAVTLLPTLGFGKGLGNFVVQGTIGASLPTGHVDKIGDSVIGNLALQYRVFGLFWPEIEANWTYYADGPRGGLSQLYLTPGLVFGRIPITKDLKLTVGIGYSTAIAPDFRAKPLTPGYNHALIATTRVSF